MNKNSNKEKFYKSVSGHSLENLKRYHQNATSFFAAELTILKEVIPKITDKKLAKLAILLISSTQTGAALLQLANQTDTFTNESIMLSRAFIEKIINFCYVSICDDKEYRAFILHPIYKYYHNTGSIKPEDEINFDNVKNMLKIKQKKQEELKKSMVVQEALEIFSDKNPNMNWTKKTLNQRISVIEKSSKVFDAFIRLSKIEYYSNASEALHGSLYGCSYNVGAFDPDFDHSKKEELDKKLYKDSACNLLRLGMLVHETFTLISYSTDIKEIWNASYKNRNKALNLHFHILEKKIPSFKQN